ncbi:ergothioneine biosynthesis protein EgtB [uncultured Oxalicibacterium sp.]|uniref:ergothioneine biosynthesis protein EgtB n=1 Tax=uncultured Oxalicibacterium sp. TaxID=1168540 RepID=UPI0025EC13B1|nr:ergothioneine biosynthesis protein EgtB [uncultured Oxalicibacterium sp.]
MNAKTDAFRLIDPELLPVRYQAVRDHSVSLASPLSDEDCGAQSMPDASPIKWHLAHTTWFFETFILERFESDFRPFHPAFRMLFNSYYNDVGDRHARPQRGLLTRPSLNEVRAYRRDVDARMRRLLARDDGAHLLSGRDSRLMTLLELGLQHEQQHQELMMTDVLYLFSCNPLKPAYDDSPPHKAIPLPLQWQAFDAGVVHIGAQDGFCFDNELPRHRQYVEAYGLASRLVTNAEYLAFIEDGGYRTAALWLSEGWDWVCREGLQHPLYWQLRQDAESHQAWQGFGLNGLQRLDPHAAATQLSYFEADAYARWAGARLPTEAEWEHAATQALQSDESVLTQLFGVCWQWTSSSYSPYPGFQVAAGALGEYNGKFMANQYVLRGSSCVTPPGHSRISYRNFFPTSARWQFTGIRLARDGNAL